MAKLYFRYAAMNAGKSTILQVAHNYGNETYESVCPRRFYTGDCERPA